jgi:hypothetical protein
MPPRPLVLRDILPRDGTTIFFITGTDELLLMSLSLMEVLILDLSAELYSDDSEVGISLGSLEVFIFGYVSSESGIPKY